MRGHVAKKGNRYYAVIYEGVDQVTGRQRHRWYAGGATRKEAEKLLVEMANATTTATTERPSGSPSAPTSRGGGCRPSGLSSATRPGTRTAATSRSTSSPASGASPAAPHPRDLDGFYAELMVDGRRNGAGGGLAPRTVRIIHGMLRKALADACRKGTLLRNVADLADPPKPSAYGRKELRIWNAAQLRQFLDEVAAHGLHPAFFLAANTGMRRGEVLGLRWDDVDLDAARLSVRHAVLNVAYELVVADVKTPTSRRTIDLDFRTVDVLRRWRRTQLDEGLALGRRPDDHGIVFAALEGGPTHADLFSQTFNRHVAKSTLPRIRLHDLRHTHASILLKAGVPVKVVSERLGHSSPAFTMTVYQHVLPGMQADAAATFSAAVFGDWPCVASQPRPSLDV